MRFESERERLDKEINAGEAHQARLATLDERLARIEERLNSIVEMLRHPGRRGSA